MIAGYHLRNLERLSCEHFRYRDGEVSDELSLVHNTFVCSTEDEDSDVWFIKV